MPNFIFARSDGQNYMPQNDLPYVPYYAVLFWYGKDSDFTNTSSGTLNGEYYRQYREIYYPNVSYYNTDGTYNNLKSNPFIACVNADANWELTTGVCTSPSTSIPNTGATLFDSNSHNPLSMVRKTVYNSFGYKSGDPTASVVYVPQTGTYNHNHTANNIAATLRSLQIGEPDKNGNIIGISALAVNPIIRDPQLSTSGIGYTDKKLKFLPKNIVVFGNNLPSGYSRTDTSHLNPVGNNVLPLIAYSTSGMISVSNSLVFSIQSSTVPNHNHNVVPLSAKNLSNKANQTAYNIIEAGAHAHTVTYTANVAIRSKILKAWVTTEDQTLIANGVIIAYSMGKNTQFAGLNSNSNILPVNWHFCDGRNGTPDLRGYFIYANFNSSNNCHDTIYNTSNTIIINNVTMAANGDHSHMGPDIGQTTGLGAPIDIGSHTYQPETLNHVHTISTANTFKYSPTDTANVINITVSNNVYSYTPPTVSLAFIMYNANIV